VPKPRAAGLLALCAAAGPGLAAAETPDPGSPLTAELHGDLGSFFVASWPRPWITLSDETLALAALSGLSEEEALAQAGLSEDPSSTGTVSGRLKLSAEAGRMFSLDAHAALVAASPGAASPLGATSTGAGLGAPQAIDLAWSPDTGSGLDVRGRIDRLVLAARLDGLDIRLGRQPISFGTGLFFAPMDLVNPFSPATIDTEYKPGVDALRLDAYAGMASQLTVALAYAGPEPLLGEDRREEGDLDEDLVLAATGQTTVGVTDMLLFVGLVHAEPVFGVGSVSAVGPVGIHGDLTLTLPAEDDPFVRVVVGADARPTTTTSVGVEAYVQSFGSGDPGDYLSMAESDRFSRGEVWQLGRTYAALSAQQEITPLIGANLAVIANVEDPSAMVAGGLSWSVAENASARLGTFLGVGAPPDSVAMDIGIDPSTGEFVMAEPFDGALEDSVQSEFGLYPQATYLQLQTYF